MQLLAALSLLLAAGAPVPPSGDLVVWLSRSAHATQGLGMEAVLAQALRDHSVLAVSAQDLASLDPDSLARLRSFVARHPAIDVRLGHQSLAARPALVAR